MSSGRSPGLIGLLLTNDDTTAVVMSRSSVLEIVSAMTGIYARSVPESIFVTLHTVPSFTNLMFVTLGTALKQRPLPQRGFFLDETDEGTIWAVRLSALGDQPEPFLP